MLGYLRGNTKKDNSAGGGTDQQHSSSVTDASASTQQVVRYSKMTTIRLAELQNLLPKGVEHSMDPEESEVVSCLLLATERSIQVWILFMKSQSGSGVEPLRAPHVTRETFKKECLFCKTLPEVCQLDLLHVFVRSSDKRKNAASN